MFNFFINKEKPENDELKKLEILGNKYKDDHVKIFYLNMIKYKSIFKSFENNDIKINENNIYAAIVKGKRKKYIAITKDENNNLNNIMENILSGGGNFKLLKKGLIFEDNVDKVNEL